MAKRFLFCVLSALCAVPYAMAEDHPLIVPIKRLSLESALKVAKRTLEACREKGLQIGVTVVDRGGHPQVVLRDVLAPDVTLTISRQKAYTALSFNVPTSALEDRANSPLGWIDGLVMYPGGMPIYAGGELIGAVGVSGASSGATDEACARAGVDAIQEDLDMSDM